jgi:hypothetical protein
MSRKDLTKLLAKSLDFRPFRRALAQVSQETATRPVRSCRCVVVEIPERAKPRDFAHITPGTVTAFVAREGDPLLRRLTETLEADNRKDFTSATAQIIEMATEMSRKIAGGKVSKASKSSTRKVTRKGQNGRKTAPVESGQHDFPSFAEIAYANKTLVGHVFVDDLLRVQAHAFPYNGGYLDNSRFSIIEYYRAGVNTPLSCVLLVRRPELSEIEREALRLVPSSASANNIAASVVEPFTPALMEFLAIATPVAAQWLYNEFVNFITMLLHGGTTTALTIPDAVLESEDFQHKLKTLPPEVTAAELVRLRVDILLGKPPK